MKKNFPGNILKAVVISSASLAAGTMTVYAQEMTPAQEAAPNHTQDSTAIHDGDVTPLSYKDSGFYLSADVGVNFASQLQGEAFGISDGVNVSLEPGVAGYLSMGYDCKLSKHFS